MSKAPNTPGHLTALSKALWRNVMSDYQLEPHHVTLLTLACQALDRAEQAREILDSEGLTVATNSGSKAHPCVMVERDNRHAFVKIMHELGLDVDETSRGPGRPPATSKYGDYAGNGKHHES